MDVYKEVIRSMPYPIAILTADLKIVDVSSNFLEVYDTNEQNAIGANYLEIIKERNHESETAVNEFLDAVAQVKVTKAKYKFGPVRYDIFNAETDRLEIRHWKHIVVPIIEDSQPRYFVHQIEDVTEEVSKEKALHKEMKEGQMFKLLVSTIQDYGIFMLDPNGYVKTWNEGAHRLKQYEASEIIGKHFSVFYTAQDMKIKKPENELKYAIQYGRVEDESWRVKKDKTTFWALVVITAIYDENHQLLGFAKVTRDLTERKTAEEAVINAYKDSARVKSEFLANMSHEIRTPINGVMGMVELLSTTNLDLEQRKYVDFIRSCSASLLSVINDVLDFSKIEAGKLSITNSDFKVTTLLDDIKQFINILLVDKESVRFELIAENIPENLYLKGDVLRLKQIFMNLLGNAVKFTDGGTISLTCKIIKTEKMFHVLRFQVSDSGIGINLEDQKKLFTMFTQIESSQVRKYHGTGLGLAITKKLTELMNGRIWLTSEHGKGSSFFVEIPFEVGASQEDPMLNNHKHAKISGKVLIVDDNEVNLMLTRKMVEMSGCTVETATDGSQAVNLVQEKQYDLIFMDLQMPIKNGYDASRDIRKLGKLTPIVALTANVLKGEPEKCIEAGMDDFLPKPISIRAVNNMLRKYLTLSNTMESSSTSQESGLATSSALLVKKKFL